MTNPSFTTTLIFSVALSSATLFAASDPTSDKLDGLLAACILWVVANSLAIITTYIHVRLTHNPMLSTLLTLALAAPSPQPRDILPKSQGCRIESITPLGSKTATPWQDKSALPQLRAELRRLEQVRPRDSHYLICI